MTKRKKKLQLIDGRKLAITVLVTVFTIVPVVHVATFTGSFEPEGYEWLGYVYALGLDLGIAVCALFTRWDTTKAAAWVSYFILVVTDGLLNVAHVKPYDVYSAVYAIFPTLIVALLSILARQADKLSAKSGRLNVTDAIAATIGAKLATDEQPMTTTEQPKTATIRDWREIRAGLNGTGDDLSAADVQRLLKKEGFAPAKESTARRWANVS